VNTIKIGDYEIHLRSGKLGWSLTILYKGQIVHEKADPMWYKPMVLKYATEWINNDEDAKREQS
jgi:hypothetical protein